MRPTIPRNRSFLSAWAATAQVRRPDKTNARARPRIDDATAPRTKANCPTSAAIAPVFEKRRRGWFQSSADLMALIAKKPPQAIHHNGETVRNPSRLMESGRLQDGSDRYIDIRGGEMDAPRTAPATI